MNAASIELRRAGREAIPDLEQLYATLHQHQTAVAPTLAGLSARSVAESWARRRMLYERLLATPEAFVLLAERDAATVGYAVVSLGDGFQGWTSSERVGDVHDLVVLPEERGRGVATALMDAAERELAATGVTAVRLRVLAANADALRFYARRGMTTISHILLRQLGASDDA